MTFLTNEQELCRINNDKIILTDQRLLLIDKTWSSTHTLTVFLENITSIETFHQGKNYLRYLGFASLIAAFYFLAANEFRPVTELSNFCVWMSAISFGLWWLSRTHTVKIYCNSGRSLDFSVPIISDEEMAAFVHTIQETKIKRIYKKSQGTDDLISIPCNLSDSKL